MCGIAAYHGNEAFTNVIALLIELQHRGQEAWGISYVDGDELITLKKVGSVICSLNDITRNPRTTAAIGHVRYSTAGGYLLEGAQPAEIKGKIHFSLGFNGNIINYLELAKRHGVLKPPGDAIVLAKLIHDLAIEHGNDIVEALKELPHHVIGSYSLVVLTSDSHIIAARDPLGFRSLSMTFNDNKFMVASETAALRAINDGKVHEIAPGEIVIFDEYDLEIARSFTYSKRAICAFEYIYFARPDSVINGVSVYHARLNMGRTLAHRAPVDADIVVPIPESSRIAALGYSRESGIPLEEAISITRYLGRSFIMPPCMRDKIASLKYGIITEAVRGKRVVLIDDSIVRGTTLRRLITKIRKAGAKEVHVRIVSPPIRYPCFMGIDMPTHAELAINNAGNFEELAKSINANSLAYNTVENVVHSIGFSDLCLACFTGSYPIHIEIQHYEKVFGGRSTW